MKEVIYKAYRFRLYPTDEQQMLIEKHFGCSRFVFNYFLNFKDTQFKSTGQSDNYVKLASRLKDLKSDEEHSWLKEVNSQSLQASLKHLDNAYLRFFRKESKFPKFKAKYDTQSFSVPQNVRIERKHYLSIPKFKEGIRFKKSQEVKGIICSATISKTKTNKYFVSILTEQQNGYSHVKTNKEVGIDLGIKDFVITSDEVKYPNPKYLKKYRNKLKKYQKILSKKKNGSHRKDKFRLKVASIHEKIANSREDFQHKLSNELLNEYDLICVESLSVKNMMKNHKLAQAISDASWYSFISKLKYKANWRGKTIVQIDQYYPSSKTCSNCNYKMNEMSLDVREWNCPKCGHHHDRDINAAKNILAFGKALIANSDGTSEYSHGDSVKLKITPHKSVKSGINEVIKVQVDEIFN